MPRARRNFVAVDNRMPRHPKIEPLSDAAFRLLVTLWCECDEHESDGRVKASTWARRGTAKARRELLDSGMAEPDGDDYLMHDYLDHQRSAAEIHELREKRSMAGAKGGKARALAIADAKQVTEQTPEQVPRQTGSKAVAETGTEDRDKELTTESGDRNETLRAVDATEHPPQRPPRPADEPTCAKHPTGNPTGEPCAGCARVREHRDRAAERQAEKDRLALEERRRNCPDCEGTGKVLDAQKNPTSRKCDHLRRTG